MRFGRSQMNATMKAHPDDAIKLFLPPKARGLFFAKPIVRFTLWLFGRKYPGSSRAEVGVALTNLQGALRTSGTGYLVGDALTFADVAVSSALFFSMDFGRSIPASEELAHEFPDLVEWRKRIFAQHFVGDEKAAFEFQPPTKKNT
jgi:glutathione S-transferase